VGEGRRESGADQAATDQTTGRRLTVPEAAEFLEISGDAVRSRIKRGTLPTVREGGRVYVVVGSAETDRPSAQAQPTNRPGEDRLYGEMQERIRYLERQVEEEREARRRADTIIAQLSQANVEQARTIRALEAPKAESPREWAIDEEVAREDKEMEVRPGVSDEQKHYERYVQPYEDTERPETVGGSEAESERAVPRTGRVEAEGRVQEERRSWWRKLLGR
jgi:hypothetical protein